MRQIDMTTGTMDKNLVTQFDDSATPNIIKNIERVSIRYREYVKSETNEELDNETKHLQKIKELRKKELKDPRATQ